MKRSSILRGNALNAFAMCLTAIYSLPVWAAMTPTMVCSSRYTFIAHEKDSEKSGDCTVERSAIDGPVTEPQALDATEEKKPNRLASKEDKIAWANADVYAPNNDLYKVMLRSRPFARQRATAATEGYLTVGGSKLVLNGYIGEEKNSNDKCSTSRFLITTCHIEKK